ncbi:hypothetical protein GT755_12350 [Herbidospora sp. NEAU-GS84]|uniref:DNA-binding protein n=1 Tax=Herbidospora solisilvae TaxID=2696284 RepID=A0A7C9N6R8_9ACTN|nr:hypothetical protein [Herbidospora solisilvae]
MGAAEIGLMLGGLSRQRVSQLTSSDDFPEPVVRLKMGAIWRANDVRKWARDHNRTLAEGWDTDAG